MHNRPLVYETVFLLLQIASYVEEVEDRVEIRKELESDNAIGRKNVKERKKAGFLSEKAVRMRRKNPTTADHEKLSQSTLRQRCQETMTAALEIHGGSQENQSPGTVGLFEAMEARSSVKDIAEAMSSGSGTKFRNKILPKVYKQDLGIFESSTKNM